MLLGVGATLVDLGLPLLKEGQGISGLGDIDHSFLSLSKYLTVLGRQSGSLGFLHLCGTLVQWRAPQHSEG